jgi:hypothetical protein
MFTIMFASGYFNQEVLETAPDEQTAREIADSYWTSGYRDVTVEDQYGAVVYEPCDDASWLLDEV